MAAMLFVFELAHELADELDLAPAAFEVGDALGVFQRDHQLFGQVFGVDQLVEQAAVEREQLLAQVLQAVAFALHVGLAHVHRSLELAFELQIEFAAGGNELATDEIAFGGFAGHGFFEEAG